MNAGDRGRRRSAIRPRLITTFEGCKSLSLKRGVTVRQLAGTQSYEERIDSYRKLAASGDVDAQFELGACYCKGKGVKKNAAEAAKWWRKAADQGHARAQFALTACQIGTLDENNKMKTG